MKKQKLIITRGLPASGKTTWSRAQVDASNGQIKRVNKDDLRLMVDNGKHSKAREQMINGLQDILIRNYLNQGFSVIVDNTNFGYEEDFKALAEDFDVNFEIKDFTNVPLDTCIERNAQRDNPVPIMYMYNKYVRKAPVYEDSHYIICDIDGTLAHMEGRDPYDGSKVHMDKVDLPVKTILETFSNRGYHVVIVTARDAKYKDVTIKWLSDNCIDYDDIYFRAEGDNRCDSIVKKELFEEEIEPAYGKPLFVLDDRDRVVKVWRDLGIKCLQVEYGNF